MRVGFAAVVSAIVVVSVSASARAQSGLSVGANAGVAFPAGDISNSVNTGYTVAVTLGAQSKGDPLGFRAEGSFTEFGWSGGFDAKHRIVAGTANLTYDLMPSGTSALYAIGGAGIYGSYDNGPAGPTSRQTSPGFNVGAGYRFALSGFNCYIEGRYHYTTGGSIGNDHYVPVTFGLQF